MKKILAAVLLCVTLMLSGCDSWMDGSYYSVEPNNSRSGGGSSDSIEVSSYADIRDALLQMIRNGTTKSVLYLSGMDVALMEQHTQIAVNFVMTNDPLAAYAVEEIRYDFGTNTAKPAVSVEISYIHGRSEILRIKQAKNMDAAVRYITQALDECDAGVVIQVDDYEALDVAQLVQDYVDTNPGTCMEMPQVTAVTYPDQGQRRVLEISFAYQTSRDSLRNMQDTVKPIFASANLYVSGDAEDMQKISLLYSFLMERFDYKIETSITPSYSLLRHGVGDSKAFAVVYAAMCRQLDISCQTVSGTKNGEPWYWNVIHLDGEYYHLDLLACSQNGTFYLKTAPEMEGYVWDYSAYEDVHTASSAETQPPA